jgi:hypothetical protein
MTAYKSFENMAEFKYFGMTVMSEKCVYEEIMSRLALGNVCCHSVQNILSLPLLSENLQIKIYKTTVIPILRIGC